MQTDTNKAETTVPAVRIEFAYDAQSRRIGKTTLTGWTGAAYSTTNTTVFVYDGWNLVSEVGTVVPGGPSRTNLYAWGLDLSCSMQGAGGIGGLLFSTLTGTTSVSSAFYAFDGNGNVATLVDSADGTVAAAYEYSPFGETIRATGPMARANPYRFSSKYTDDETGLLYYDYRYYSPNLGRWLSRDPIGEVGGVNLLVFVANCPVLVIDTDGRLQWIAPPGIPPGGRNSVPAIPPQPEPPPPCQPPQPPVIEPPPQTPINRHIAPIVEWCCIWNNVVSDPGTMQMCFECAVMVGRLCRTPLTCFIAISSPQCMACIANSLTGCISLREVCNRCVDDGLGVLPFVRQEPHPFLPQVQRCYYDRGCGPPQMRYAVACPAQSTGQRYRYGQEVPCP
jgi:RHS repeat-associated protein